METQTEKEAIVAEYLIGDLSLRMLAAKHGVNFRNIHRWVQQYRGKHSTVAKKKKSKKVKAKPDPQEVRQLKEELRKAQLLNELLNEMIDIAESDHGLSIRKKSGTKRS